MNKEKKKNVDNDINNRHNKKCPKGKTKKKYEAVNFVSKTWDSIYTTPIEEDIHGGETFYASSLVRKIVRQELVAAGVLHPQK